MYGPPPDPQQIVTPTGLLDAPWAWVVCVVVGVLIAWFAGPRRPLAWITGVVLALTAPAGAFLLTDVWGAFPTIDKAGSLLFYGDGVAWRFWHADDPAIRLIGVHVGHLWVTAAFDLLVAPFAAFNLQAMLNLILSWYCARLLFVELCDDEDVSLLLAFPFGMGLHLFRDIQWYTIEKSGVYWIPLYAWALVRARRDPRFIAVAAVVYAATFFYNVYFGVLCAGIGALALLSRDKRVFAAVAASALAALPFVWLQGRMIQGEGTLGTPELFLTQRAPLDVFTLWPPMWNRLEAWRALNVVALLLAALGVLQRKNRWLLGFAGVFFVLALGPAHNPVYRALFEVVPGFWRIAKPETFFHVTWLALLAIGARRFADRRPSRRALYGWGLLFALGWVVSVRTHPVYPGFSEPIPMELSKDWQRRVPR